MRTRTTIFGTAGVLATVFGLGLWLVPGLVLVGPVDDAIAFLGGEATTLALLAGIFAAVAVLAVARSRPAPAPPTSADPRFERLAVAPPERVTAHPDAITAAGIDDDVVAACEAGGETLFEVRELLRETAASVYAEREGIPEAEAATAVDRGEWTDDPVAATFLAGPDGPSPSLTLRLRLWLVPVRERTRRIERTLAATERVSER